jgi:cytochrome c553
MRRLLVTVIITFASCGIAHGADIDASKLPTATPAPIDFARDVRPIFEKTCYSCHGAEKQKSNYRLDSRPHAMKGGDLGVLPIVAGDSAHSPLIHYVSGLHPEVTMPPKGEPLTSAQVGVLRAWIDQGAKWPADAGAATRVADKADWWSFRAIVRPAVPSVRDEDRGRVRNAIDAFVLAKLREKGLRPSAEAERRTLIRRLYFDLIGLPPSPEDVATFVADPDPGAYERLADRLLASPRYGERWARHWLDAAHYGDTHGFDKDKVRENAWPYRDYVIRALNDDRPYGRFVREQVAGDHFYPDSPDAVPALGFLAAGPWDFVGHVELREGTIDKAITRNLDRDDVVSVVMNTFTSLTAQCARCHNHKFDAIAQEDYYSLQAVFAGIDRADRPYEADPKVARQRRDLQRRVAELNAAKGELEQKVAAAGGAELAAIDAKLAELAAAPKGGAKERPEVGYHSQIADRQDVAKWVQVDLGEATAVERVVLVGCHDDFNGIGAGFGFPVRYRVEVCGDADFGRGVTVVADFTGADVPNPGVRPQTWAARGATGRYVRVTATKLAPRKGDFIFALGELSVLTADGRNAARGKPVAALDSIEAPVRWRASNLVDGYAYGMKAAAADPRQVAALQATREAIVAKTVDGATRDSLVRVRREIDTAAAELKAVPPAGRVFAASTEFAAQGAFSATHGKPRAIHLLYRGSEKQPKQEVGPGTIALPAAPGLAARFAVSADQGESPRRAALAEWIVDRRNPLTWRSIVNRVWQSHFGRGIVDTPSDFGRMGSPPSSARTAH